jgi:predicted DNA-binding protein
VEPHTELSKKTTIRLSPKLHEQLPRLAAQQGTSLGELVRAACEKQYAQPSTKDRLSAVNRLAALRLPVSTPRKMKRQSVLAPEEILP